MINYPIPKKAEIVYFSGTGSTRLVARQFEADLREKQIEVYTYNINIRKLYTPQYADLLLIIFPVYAFNAPRPVYEFIKKLPYGNGRPAAVISVSGGGEVTLNNACRLHCIRRLAERGYRTVYEAMLVMPSNVFIATPEELSIRLLAVLPSKVSYICRDLLSGTVRRTKPKLLSRTFSVFGELEKTRIGGRLLGRLIKANKQCNGCGICQKGCPTGNIKMRNNIPVFDHKCAICLKCIYNCPKKALSPAICKFFILKQGYPLKDWVNKSKVYEDFSDEELAKSIAFGGLKKYFSKRN